MQLAAQFSSVLMEQLLCRTANNLVASLESSVIDAESNV